MQNKPNFQYAQMNISNIITRNYKNFIPLAGQENKPNPSGLRCLLRSCRTDQTQFKPIRQACVVCEGVAGLIKPKQSQFQNPTPMQATKMISYAENTLPNKNRFR